ncbi:hypothetical protein [Desulfohalobium retbaense]|jgi:hypothetical protein|uniref:Uncharacterized protein n=1 Tax=Desulfohalobium retbaense (strain ATCC 49708 / DSM 5692 / JCM 16813 / HR100) TaxID=485915 RepID=C8X1G7_DESRD|nr:hypothetical protein [Desulfohalobium retbaense]ACV68264.1 conserved hypothetical protein [Desulfohalobium retbaense DSM 5692]
MHYIMFEDFAGKPVPIIFPEKIRHEEMREQIPYARVLAAGRVEIIEGILRCVGESKELGVSARNRDASMIAAQLGMEA